MMRAKYIVGLALDDINNRRLEAILFSPTMVHREVADNLFGTKTHIVGAGFYHLDLGLDAVVSGESESLMIGPSPLDQKYIERALGLRTKPMSDDERLADYRQGVEIARQREQARHNHR